MALKRAQFLTYGADQVVDDTRKFLEEHGVELEVRDIEKRPLSERELVVLFGYLDLRNFINPFSESFEKNGLEDQIPVREELLKLIAADNTLLRKPIVKTTRLIMVGTDRTKLCEMLQIDPNSPMNGNGDDPQPPQHERRHHHRDQRHHRGDRDRNRDRDPNRERGAQPERETPNRDREAANSNN